MFSPTPTGRESFPSLALVLAEPALCGPWKADLADVRCIRVQRRKALVGGRLWLQDEEAGAGGLDGLGCPRLFGCPWWLLLGQSRVWEIGPLLESGGMHGSIWFGPGVCGSLIFHQALVHLSQEAGEIKGLTSGDCGHCHQVCRKCWKHRFAQWRQARCWRWGGGYLGSWDMYPLGARQAAELDMSVQKNESLITVWGMLGIGAQGRTPLPDLLAPLGQAAPPPAASPES